METSKKDNWQPLRELALKTPYTMEYLSLMARRRQLKVKKVGRLWYSTLENIKDFEQEMRERKEKRKNVLRDSFYEKSGMKRKPIKVAISQKTIYDQVQAELEEVLAEIREREARLREEYRGGASVGREMQYDDTIGHTRRIGRIKNANANANASAVEKYLVKEERETEELSEKLVMDLGKLLNTANQIQEDVQDRSTTTSEHRIPINNSIRRDNPIGQQNSIGHKGHIRRIENTNTVGAKESDFANHTPFLSLNYGPGRGENSIRQYDKTINTIGTEDRTYGTDGTYNNTNTIGQQNSIGREIRYDDTIGHIIIQIKFDRAKRGKKILTKAIIEI